jgi:hypothetical protein
MPSSTIETLSRQLEGVPEQSKRLLTPGTMREVLDSIPDPRKRRGIRHGLTGILAPGLLTYRFSFCSPSSCF